ncbi:MAG: hypothetical protein AAFW81_01585 [Pseudomonadota bacterium]
MGKIAISAAAAALAFSAHAVAAPFSSTVSSQPDASKAEANGSGLFERALNATASAVASFVSRSEDSDESYLWQFVERSEKCDAETADEAPAPAEPVEEKAPSGPEPIYFGF